jgi:hypothetical protein
MVRTLSASISRKARLARMTRAALGCGPSRRAMLVAESSLPRTKLSMLPILLSTLRLRLLLRLPLPPSSTEGTRGTLRVLEAPESVVLGLAVRSIAGDAAAGMAAESSDCREPGLRAARGGEARRETAAGPESAGVARGRMGSPMYRPPPLSPRPSVVS